MSETVCSPSKLQRILVKMEDTSSLSMRHRTSGLSIDPLKGFSTARVTDCAEMADTVGRCTHACSPTQTSSLLFLHYFYYC